MARKDKLIHINSKDISGSSPKLIEAGQLNNGEIAINYAENYEVIQIKNSAGKIVTFPNKLVGYKKSAQSGAELDLKNTDTIIEAFGKVAKHLSDLGNDRITKTEVTSLLSGKADKVHTHTVSQITDIDATYAKKSEIPAKYVLPTASSSTLGGVKVGAGLRIDSGVLSATGGGTADSVVWENVTGKPDDIVNITTKLSGKANKSTTLSGYGITDGVNAVSVTGSGNAVTTASVSGHTITLTKGTSFAAKTEIPTQVSQLTNDSGYVDSSALASGLAGKANTSHTHTVSQITDLTNTLSNYAKKTDIPAKYVLPTASSTTLGGVKVGAGLRIDSGVLSATGGGTADSVAWENIVGIPDDVANITTKLSGKANTSHTHTVSQITDLTNTLSNYAKKTDIPAKYVLPTASSTTLGGVKVGAGLRIDSGVLSATGGGTADSVAWENIVGIPDDVANITTKLSGKADKSTTLSGYGITDGVNAVSVTGSGNAVTTASVSGHTITLTKGASYAASSHTHTGSDIKGLTGLRALVTDTSGNVVVSDVTSVELGFLDGVTSKIQTQLSGKANTSHTHTLSQITDLYSSWDALLKAAPSNYVTRWPTFSEVGSKPNTLAGYGITDGINQFTTAGSGNALSSVTILDGGHVIKFAKDFTFAEKTDVQDAIDYCNRIPSRKQANVSYTRNNRLYICSRSSSYSLSMISTLKDGNDVLFIIHNTGSDSITITIPNSGGFVSTDDVDSITIGAGKYGEIHVISDGTNMYVRAV